MSEQLIGGHGLCLKAGIVRHQVSHMSIAVSPGATSRSCSESARIKESPDGEIGRRSGLKIRREQSRGGSSPPLGTKKSIIYVTAAQQTFFENLFGIFETVTRNFFWSAAAYNHSCTPSR
jgi:hypothetical protein